MQKIDDKLGAEIIKRFSCIWTYNRKRESYYRYGTSEER